MAALKNTREEITAINTLVVDNNIISTISCLRSNAIIVPDTSRLAVILTLENLFDANKPLWVIVIQCIQYDPNVNNYTTSPEVQQTLIDTYNLQNNIIDGNNTIRGQSWQDILKGIAAFIGGSSTTGGGGTSSSSSGSLNPFIIVGVVVASLILILIIAFKK